MISASEVRARIQGLDTEIFLKEQRIVEDAILAATNAGHYSCLVDGILSKETKQCLKNLGYVVRTICDKRKTFICWFNS